MISNETRSEAMDLGLEAKTALVLGGGGGLGGAISQTLAREGADIAVADIDADAASRTVARITQAGGRALALQWDLADLNVIDARVSSVEAALGPVSVLVNNTGGPPPSPAAGQAPALWAKHFQDMVLSVLAITDRVLAGMIDRRLG